VVVEHDDPGKGAVGCLQVGVRPVLGVPVAVLDEGDGLGVALVSAGLVRSRSSLVDVVAELHDDVDILDGQVAVGGVEAMGVALTRREGERESVETGLRELWTASAVGDWSALAATAHRLKGGSASLGVSGAAAACVAVEVEAGNADAAAVSVAIRRLSGELDRARPELEVERDRAAAS